MIQSADIISDIRVTRAEAGLTHFVALVERLLLLPGGQSQGGQSQGGQQEVTGGIQEWARDRRQREGGELTRHYYNMM